MEGHTVRAFDGDLLHLRTRVLEMGGLALDQVQRAAKVVAEPGDHAALAVAEGVGRVGAYARAIEDELIGVLARRQPVASDLRGILAIGRVAADLERVANAARKIARLGVALRRRGHPPLGQFDHVVGKMIRLSLGMLRDALDAFDRADPVAAAALETRDDELDAEFQLALREIVSYVAEDPRLVGATIDSIFLVKAIERIGDHARNIAALVPRMERQTESGSAADHR